MAAAASAPTGRALDVVELLARAGGRRLRFSDVVRETGMTQATAHAILTTLCARGWAARDPLDKTFAVGPALAVVAAAVDRARPATSAARALIAALATEFGCAASVVERVDEDLVITAFAGSGDSPAGAPGDRIRFAPPFGVAFAAWESAEEQRRWIGRSGSGDAELHRRLGEALARTRRRGYDVDFTTPALTRAARTMSTLPSDGLPTHVREITDRLLVEFATIGVLTDDDAAATMPVATIAAPVLDQRGRATLIVAVHPLRPLDRDAVTAIGRRVASGTAGIACGP
ncbi:helix-turn-helix domain-containing protein [Mycobacterium sp. MYCO198283]|uniref:helix-turn-helix domain-containing protein n=1 Tax=Mycobacterium sp. MYCO198283 TaxID=2883505 RepID=UPI001E2F6CA0|nr:helix-turn-helix domain-containing protein [Mycobacterium sp. MYCO198283]MCG5434005.1 helix-turn-helix domain-containing protein [Mycobacterium sp. MYCO198283]